LQWLAFCIANDKRAAQVAHKQQCQPGDADLLGSEQQMHADQLAQPADQQPQNSPIRQGAMHLVVLMTHKKPRQRVMQEKIRQELIAVLMACSN
jgi:hypothetical protein